jgi:hypothetical protein
VSEAQRTTLAARVARALDDVTSPRGTLRAITVGNDP